MIIVSAYVKVTPKLPVTKVSDGLVWDGPVPDYAADANNLLRKLHKEVALHQKQDTFVAEPDSLLELSKNTAYVLCVF